LKIVIAGGYGVFGSRLAELLVRDGHQVTIAGRNESKAQAAASRLNCLAQLADIRSDPSVLFKNKPDIVIDAVGPFQTYGDDPYRLPKLCIENGADYMDLSDNAEFTHDLSTLNELAKSTNTRLLSGASSVPGISSSAVAELCNGMDSVLLIDTAILPGNRASRGTSVVESIVGQLGSPFRVWRGGVWRNHDCWSEAREINLGFGIRRTARLIEVPDIRLFPDYFGAKSVLFRAGMELGTLNVGLKLLALLRKRRHFRLTANLTRTFRLFSSLLLPFGTDRGGMRVRVVGLIDGLPMRREWRLIAESGDGPYVPAVTARAAIRNLGQISAGARPCLAEVELSDIENSMTDIDVATHTEEAAAPTLFQSALEDRWDNVPEKAKALHGVQDVESFSGEAEVTRGTSIIARLAGWFFGFPPAAERVPLTITKSRTNEGEIWVRNFGGHILRSYCTPSSSKYCYRERFWVMNFELELAVDSSGMEFAVRRGWFLGIPLPRMFLPASETREYVENGLFRFDVSLEAPFKGGLIVRYSGWVMPDSSNNAPNLIDAATRNLALHG